MQLPVSNIMGYSNQFRLSGLASGLDTDTIVSQLMKIERMSYDKVYQKKQLEEWKRDQYREIISLLNDFKSSFLDYVRPENNMLSPTTYMQFSVSVTNSKTGEISNAVSARSSVNALEGTHTVKVERIATADKAVSSHGISAGLLGAPVTFSLKGKQFTVTLDNVSRVITLDNYDDLDDLINKEGTGLQDLLDKAFGEGKIIVSKINGRLHFDTSGGASSLTLYNTASGNGTENTLSLLGFKSGASNRIDVNMSLQELSKKLKTPLQFGTNGKVTFTINDKEFTFNMSDSLSKVISTINNDADAKVNIAYNEVTDKITITAKQLGDGDNIRISQKDGNFFEAMGISVTNPVTSEGVDAVVYIDNELVTRSSNEFTINGITYTLQHESEDELKVTVTQDVDKVFEKIMAFVNKYNEVVDKINSKLSEEYIRNFLPLTEEQRAELSEDEIKKWEEKAKTGLLRNDEILQDIVYNMRKALYDTVEGVDIALYSIGITTSSSYSQRGKLVVDEERLKNAIKNSPDAVMNLFCKKSDIEYNDINNRAKRMKEEGIAYRIFDIVQDNVRITRITVGGQTYKGRLLEKAGMIGDSSEFNNALSKNIKLYEYEMDRLYEALIAKEEAYYRQFTEMEKAMSQMNSQLSWLLSQFGNYR